MFDFSNYSTKSKYYNSSNKLVVGKMKGETATAAIEEFVGLKSKMYSHWVDKNSEHEKAKRVNRHVVVTIIHNEYNNVLLNKKCLRHSINITKVKILKCELIKSIRFLRLFLMIKYTLKKIFGCERLALGFLC